jgi:hypothetical protein
MIQRPGSSASAREWTTGWRAAAGKPASGGARQSSDELLRSRAMVPGLACGLAWNVACDTADRSRSTGQTHRRRRRRAARRGGRRGNGYSGERVRVMRGTSSSSSGTMVLLTFLRSSGGASRRRNGGHRGDRQRRRALGFEVAAPGFGLGFWGEDLKRGRRRLYRDRRRPQHAGPWPGACAGARCGAAGFGLELVWLGRLEDGDDDRDPVVSDRGRGQGWAGTGPLLGRPRCRSGLRAQPKMGGLDFFFSKCFQ